ncbi:hypothetical protein SK227_31075 [Pseudomonas aeruginosa]|nr:hypothetical protein [Pseudomonas aeruginosa]
MFSCTSLPLQAGAEAQHQVGEAVLQGAADRLVDVVVGGLFLGQRVARVIVVVAATHLVELARFVQQFAGGGADGGAGADAVEQAVAGGGVVARG